MKLNLLVAGVGGQGSILASHIIASAAIKNGYRARVGETFGAAQRGGAVVSHVRIGDVYAPLIGEDKADILLAVEPVEGLRVGVKYLSSTGLAILNTVPWYPVDVNIGAVAYPSLETIGDSLRRLGKDVYFVNATELAAQAGHPNTANIALIGALFGTGRLPLERDVLLDTIVERAPKKATEANVRAFDLGRDYIRQIMEG